MSFLQIMNGEINGDLYVNAAFLFKFELKSNEVNFNKLHSVTISYGGMNPQVHPILQICQNLFVY